MAVSGSSSTEEGWTDTNAYRKTLGILSFLRRSRTWRDFFAVSFVVDIESFCLHTPMKLILIPNCSILYLHSNDKFILENIYSYEYNYYKNPQIKS